MKKFIIRFLLFLIPFYFVGILILGVYHAGYETGEFCDFDELIQEQRKNHSVFIGMGYNENTAYYKYTNVNYYQPEIIALGTSRVMQFHDTYFCTGFYNCGGAVGWNYDEYLNFMKNLKYTPKVVIIGLDQWVFNPAWSQYCLEYSDYQPIEMLNRNKMSMEGKMIKDFIAGKWNFDNIDSYSINYGFNGRVRDRGFQWDGSYYYGDVYRSPEDNKDYMFADTFARIDGGYGKFEWGEHIDKQTCEYLIALLEYCYEEGIEVVGFTPPFAPSVNDRMAASSNYGYLSEISPRCREIFGEYGYEYFDYTDVRELGLDDACFIDGFHGGEVVYACLVRNMTTQGSCLQKYVDVKILDSLLDHSYNHLMLYDFIHRGEV